MDLWNCHRCNSINCICMFRYDEATINCLSCSLLCSWFYSPQLAWLFSFSSCGHASPFVNQQCASEVSNPTVKKSIEPTVRRSLGIPPAATKLCTVIWYKFSHRTSGDEPLSLVSRVCPDPAVWLHRVYVYFFMYTSTLHSTVHHWAMKPPRPKCGSFDRVVSLLRPHLRLVHQLRPGHCIRYYYFSCFY